MKITHYTPESGIRSPLALTREILSDLGPAHALGLRLTQRNIKGQYRKSLLGYFWSVIPPLITSLVWVILNGQRVVNIEDPGVPYPLFVLTGTMLWQIFSESVNAPLKGVLAGKSMLSKINFPRESLILASIYETVFNSLIKIGLIILIFAWYQYLPPLSALFSLTGLLSLMILGSTIGILLTPIGMLYSDIQRGIGIILQFGLYLTPVIYPEPKSGLIAQVMQFNPVAPILTTTRSLLLGNFVGGLGSFVWITIIACLLFLIGIFFYRVSMPILIERVGS